MGQKVVVFDKYDKGDYGRIGAWNAPAGSFSAENMLRYSTGELGVRPGLVERSPSGLANGVVHGFGVTNVPNRDAWFVQGTAVRVFSILAGNNLSTCSGALASTPTLPLDSVNLTTNTYVTNYGDKAYVIDPTAGTATCTGLTGSPSGKCIGIYGERMVLGDISGSLVNRLRFSDAADFNSWPGGNFLDVGDGWNISALAQQRQHLVVAKPNGIFVVTGVLGDGQAVRKAATGPAPVSASEAAIALDASDLFWTFGVDVGFPSTFNGARLTPQRHLQGLISSVGGANLPPYRGVAPLTGRSSGAVFVHHTDNEALVFLNDVWTKHTFGVDVTGYVSRQGAYVAMCDGGGAGANPKFWMWNPDCDSPGISGGDQMSPGDGTTTSLAGSVTFPEWWSQDGSEVTVRHVIVDFRSWNTGSATTNHFDLTVDALRRYQAGAAQASTTVSWDQAAASSSASGTLQRQVFGFGEQGPGAGFQLRFATARGIAIQRITVVLDTAPVRV